MKLSEEAGHDKWAEADLLTLNADPGDRGVQPSIRELVDYIHNIIDREPILYLAYILFAEYLTVSVGPKWLHLLEEKCKVSSGAMSVVAKHIELDKFHVEEALDCIDDLVGDPAKLPLLREVLRASMAYFERFMTELANNYDTEVPDDRASGTTVSTAHAPAA